MLAAPMAWAMSSTHAFRECERNVEPQLKPQANEWARPIGLPVVRTCAMLSGCRHTVALSATDHQCVTGAWIWTGWEGTASDTR